MVILNDAGKKVKTVKFTKDSTKTVTIKKQTSTQNLYFYTLSGKKRSAIVTKAVIDKTKPSTPTVTVKSATSILVKGETGTAVYVKYASNSGYKKMGYIRSGSGLTVAGVKPTSSGTYSVKLKDAAGNVSKVKTVTSKYASTTTTTAAASSEETTKASTEGKSSTETTKASTEETTTAASTEETYSCEIQILNQYKLYTTTDVIVYIKTNAELSTSNLNANGMVSVVSYKDVTYQTTDDVKSALRAVTGGYILSLDYSTKGAGTKTLTVTIGSQKFTKTFKVYDPTDDEAAWYSKTLASVTDDSMTKKEKMQALCAYVYSNFKYMPNDGTYLITLVSHQGAYWETMEIDCTGSTHIMRRFADILGLENTYVLDGTHEYAEITDEDGSTFILDPSPSKYTNILTSWPMVIE